MSPILVQLLITAGVIVGTAAPVVATYLGYITQKQWYLQDYQIVSRMVTAGALMFAGLACSVLLVVMLAGDWRGWWGAPPMVSLITCMICAHETFAKALTAAQTSNQGEGTPLRSVS